MADIADVMDLLVDMSLKAVYPQGAGLPGIISAPVDIAQGWPQGDDVDNAMKATPPRTLVTVFAVSGSVSDPGQILDDGRPIAASAPQILAAQPDDRSVQFSGLAAAGDHVSIIIDQVSVYSYVAQAGDTPEIVAASLALQIQSNFSGTIWSALGLLSIPAARDVIVRVGGTATIARVIHRQKQQFRISVWAPTPAARAGVARAIDTALKGPVRVPMPDGSFAYIVYQSTYLDDGRQTVGYYRRDLIFTVQYDTLDLSPAVEITNVSLQFQPGVTAINP